MAFNILSFLEVFINIWSMHVVESCVIRDGTIMMGRYLNDINVDTYDTTSSLQNLIISMFISPAKMGVLFVSILCNTRSRADTKWDTLPLGCLWIPPTVYIAPLNMNSTNKYFNTCLLAIAIRIWFTLNSHLRTLNSRKQLCLHEPCWHMEVTLKIPCIISHATPSV